jgi:forkhead box protein K
MTATSTSYDTDSATTPPAVPEKIRAYYSLVFPNFTYYLQTLSVTIGRRCIPPNSSEQGTVDVDLGPLKSVSRLHAKIEYEEDKERFVLVVIGRNGAWVDGVWSGTGSRQPLSERYVLITLSLSIIGSRLTRSQIQIASRTFEFVLPPPPAPEDSPSPSSHSSATRPRSPSVDITSISPPSSMPSHTPPPTHITPTHPKNQLPSLPGATGKVKSNLNSKKRKKSNHVPLPIPKPEDMPPRPQLTYAQLCYRAIKAMGGKATLQDINQWIMESFDWYKYNDVGWQVDI